MFYNVDKKREKHDSDCAECPKYEKATGACKGFGKICFEYDKITQTCIDPITHLPFNPNEQK